MIIVQLQGGLGNQFFQYAAGFALSSYLKTELKLDLSEFDRYKLRPYELGHYAISEKKASDHELKQLGPRHGRLGRIMNKLMKPKAVLTESSPFGFEPTFFSSPNPAYLSGYRQSPKYFEQIAPQIKAKFQLKAPPKGLNTEYLTRIRDTESVALHVRRGDYVSNPNAAKFHGSCSLEYYAEGIERILALTSRPFFYVFSDDPVWCRKNLKIPKDSLFVEHNPPEDGREDLRLMQNCKHHIIANSSFSWWGAWLAGHADQKVIAPGRWVTDPNASFKDLFPSNWIQI